MVKIDPRPYNKSIKSSMEPERMIETNLIENGFFCKQKQKTYILISVTYTTIKIVLLLC